MGFIKDFQKLYWATPQVQNWTRQSENCDYGDIIVVSKDSFLCFNSSNLENCYYCYSSRKSEDSGDSLFIENCNLCYECKSLDSCFGCVGTYHKKYQIFNKQYKREEYLKRLEEIRKWPHTKIAKEVEKLRLKWPHVYMHQVHTTNCQGDYVNHSKNCYWTFDSFECEDCLYITEACLERGCKDSVDCGPIVNTLEQCYDCAFCGYLHECSHIYWADWCSDCHWSTNIWDCNHCFGCDYLKNKEYHILNKPYPKDEYLRRTADHKKELEEAGIKDFYGLIHYPETSP